MTKMLAIAVLLSSCAAVADESAIQNEPVTVRDYPTHTHTRPRTPRDIAIDLNRATQNRGYTDRTVCRQIRNVIHCDHAGYPGPYVLPLPKPYHD